MKPFFILILLALAAYGQQQKRIAIVNTEDDGEPPIKNSELTHLTDKLREIANKTLPSDKYAVMTQQSIVAFLGSQEDMVKECRAAEGCLAKLGRKINADYIGQARIGRFGKDLAIKVELYESGSGNLINSFTAESKDIYGLLSVLNKEAPDLFKKLLGTSDVVSGLENSFTDSRDGKKYRTVVIGKQTWMAENLNYNANGSKCYDNKPANCDKYGRLYNWETAMKACPKGWHLPSKEEWQILVDFVGGEKIAGKKLKVKSGWEDYEGKSGNGTDEFGFSAMPGGAISDGNFDYVGIWWTTSEYDANRAYCWTINYINETATWYHGNKSYLPSVRCLKD
jgi:uncharacterized protein (TIGR02145 family)